MSQLESVTYKNGKPYFDPDTTREIIDWWDSYLVRNVSGSGVINNLVESEKELTLLTDLIAELVIAWGNFRKGEANQWQQKVSFHISGYLFDKHDEIKSKDPAGWTYMTYTAFSESKGIELSKVANVAKRLGDQRKDILREMRKIKNMNASDKQKMATGYIKGNYKFYKLVQIQ
ncbi:hypothetical protein LCL85_19890 [Vibrio alginolyticus]|nr:hypothetical protein [Vibrio alginolyticus]